MSSLVIHSLIGAGAYGHVYHASWKERRVAVKKFYVVQDDVHQIAAIQREVEILKTLAYRHIIQFYGTTYHEGMLLLIMDYAEGGSLQRAITARRLTDWPTKIRIAHEIARGLAYIHHEGVIHRDLKSGNVLLTRLMEVKLCDFGLATVKIRAASMSTTLKGAFRWMAPELFALRPEYSTKSDMYALGMVMWEMAANSTMPFQRQADNQTVMIFVKSGEREELPCDTPVEYRKWVERCWAQNPLERPEASQMAMEDDIPHMTIGTETDVTMMSATTEYPRMAIPPMSREGTRATAGIVSHTPSYYDVIHSRANGGDVEAQMALAATYENGVGVHRDHAEAIKWYLRAADQGSIEAQCKAGELFYHGCGTPMNLFVAAYWTRQAAAKGHPLAQYNLGWMYSNGHGVERNYVEAVSWYRKSAEQKMAAAQYSLGVMYANGHGVKRDYTKAASWYSKSAEQGNDNAQYNLGLIYENGQGVKRDYVAAVSWYHKSAEQGNAAAQYNLGMAYENGHGTRKDIQQATLWYRKAAEQGHLEAKGKISASMLPVVTPRS
ncbi:copper transport protein ctr1 [Actinomortierella ambigua]|uniref:Copper transport protein ctr1 n=1 Tax=Actinomortierella ambigua TaxID=1343610 RepID=A0A9P6PRY1_9FUNG|nr:copper transport protein ctr1 [Actinomortierella ambigua]